jgi:hypothetical protein
MGRRIAMLIKSSARADAAGFPLPNRYGLLLTIRQQHKVF